MSTRVRFVTQALVSRPLRLLPCKRIGFRHTAIDILVNQWYTTFFDPKLIYFDIIILPDTHAYLAHNFFFVWWWNYWRPPGKISRPLTGRKIIKTSKVLSGPALVHNRTIRFLPVFGVYRGERFWTSVNGETMKLILKSPCRRRVRTKNRLSVDRTRFVR